MKINLPVQNIPSPYPKGQVLVSKTDLKGTIIYANDAFIALSGYSKEELVGQNHNLVRHPDMPPEAFEDLWDTVKKGLPWKGVVKNRCKDGRYYWVHAFVVPVFKSGAVAGYMSVRTEPTPEQVSNAESLYQRVKSKQTEIKRKVTWWEQVSLSARFMGALGSIIFCLLAIGIMSFYIIESMQQEAQSDIAQDAVATSLLTDALQAQVEFKTQVLRPTEY
ncbi:MAG: PAS domain-containing protein [Nitrosomonadales bacterium]